jgi:hypothetical protein
MNPSAPDYTLEDWLAELIKKVPFFTPLSKT